MKVVKFEDLIAWQKAQDFAVEIYSCFGESKDWDFRNQICRAAVSISNNIAEGFDRSSNADFVRFLFNALGSASEVKSMIYLAKRLKYIDSEVEEKLLSRNIEISKIISGLIKSLRK